MKVYFHTPYLLKDVNIFWLFPSTDAVVIVIFPWDPEFEPDKVNRLVNLIIRRDSEGQAEPVEDAFADLSVYGIIARIVKNGKWGKWK